MNEGREGQRSGSDDVPKIKALIDRLGPNHWVRSKKKRDLVLSTLRSETMRQAANVAGIDLADLQSNGTSWAWSLLRLTDPRGLGPKQGVIRMLTLIQEHETELFPFADQMEEVEESLEDQVRRLKAENDILRTVQNASQQDGYRQKAQNDALKTLLQLAERRVKLLTLDARLQKALQHYFRTERETLQAYLEPRESGQTLHGLSQRMDAAMIRKYEEGYKVLKLLLAKETSDTQKAVKDLLQQINTLKARLTERETGASLQKNAPEQKRRGAVDFSHVQTAKGGADILTTLFSTDKELLERLANVLKSGHGLREVALGISPSSPNQEMIVRSLNEYMRRNNIQDIRGLLDHFEK